MAGWGMLQHYTEALHIIRAYHLCSFLYHVVDLKCTLLLDLISSYSDDVEQRTILKCLPCVARLAIQLCIVRLQILVDSCVKSMLMFGGVEEENSCLTALGCCYQRLGWP